MSILICYDGSPSAQRAIAVTARALAGNDITLLHVWEPPLAVLADSFGDKDDETVSIDRLERMCMDYGERTLAQGEAIAKAEGLTVSSRLERSHLNVWSTILDVADGLNADVIVIGTRGRTPIQTNLLGSISAAVAHNAVLPVLLVPDAIALRAPAPSQAVAGARA